MRARVALALVAGLLTTPLAAQRGSEWQAGIVSAVSPDLFVGGGGGWARRAARVRVGAAVAGGVAGGQAAVRGEVLVGYLLMPGRRQGLTVYAAGGLALTATRGARSERLVAVLGIEQAPARRHGWYLEAGVGGGIRVAAGWRWRTLRR